VSKFSLGWLRNLFVPIIILSVLFVAFGAYYLYWVPNRQRHLDHRGFRYLKTLSDQLRLTINTYDKMMDNAMNAGVTKKDLPAYLNLTVPQLTVPEDSEANHAIDPELNKYGDPPTIAIEADEGTHFLYLAFGYGDKPKTKSNQRVVRTDLEVLVNSLLGQAELISFDVVLLARSDGRVIFQKSLSGVEIAQLKNLEDVSGTRTGKDVKQIDASSLSTSSQLEEVKIAGARYRLYSQPLQIGFLPAKAAEQSDDQGGPTWVLCGMVRADHFRSESQLIPYSYILTMLAAILLAAASYPFLRLYLSIPGERLRARDVAITAIFTCLIAAVITFIFADLYFWDGYFGPDAKADMARLAHAIDANFQREQQAAFVALNELDRYRTLLPADHHDNDALTSSANVRLLFGKDEDPRCNPKEACKVNILTDEKLYPILKGYPYLFFAFWGDADGRQRIKWTTRQHATPFIPLDEVSAPFYPAVRRALLYPRDSSTVATCGLGPQYSPSTGQNIITLWAIVPLSQAQCGVKLGGGDSNASTNPPNKQERIWAALVTQPVSLYHAILPGGYQFAVLNPDGMVVFHSDATRNLRENFFAETDMDPDLQSRVEMRSEGPVTANYMGRPHRMYVLPMDAGGQDGRWAIVIFRDLHIEEVMNLEILSLVSVLFLLYAAAMTGLVLIFSRIRGVKSERRWFWPDSRLMETYRRIAVFNAVSVVVLLALSHFVSALALLICAVLVPAVVLVLNMAAVSRVQSSGTMAQHPEEPPTPDWQSPYFAAGATLVLVIAVLPCLSLFKGAADFEHRLLIENTILQLARDLQNRDVTMRDLYREMYLGDHRDALLEGPEKQSAADLEGEKQPPREPKPYYSYHQLLSSTSVSKTHELIHDAPDPSAAENALLSFFSYPYNKRAADDRYLAEGKSDVWRWTSSNSGRERSLELTREETGGQVRSIKSTWRPFVYPWGRLTWWLGLASLLAGVYALVRISLSRIFQLDRVPPPPVLESDSGLNPAGLIAELPMSLLLIGHETSGPISALLHRSDVQVREATVLQEAPASSDKSAADAGFSRPPANPIDAILRDGRPLVLRNFERVSDEPAAAARAHAALNRLVSALGNSVILISSMDPVLVPSIEASDRWRYLLRSFVRIDLNTTPRQRVAEEDADYYSRISTESYFHWLFAALPKLEKLVMLQLAQEKVVNPNDSELLDGLFDQGMVERRHGLLAVKDQGFAHFLKHALPHHTVKHWEKAIAGRRPFSLQNSLMVFGIGVVAFLVYTQGDVFNTWVTYATGVAAALPKVLQLFDNLRGKSGATS